VKGIVVITTGGNDLIHDYGRSAPRDGAMYGCTASQASEWKESFRERLTGIIEGVNTRFPGGCEIFLATIYDPTDGVGDIHHGFLLLPRWPDGLKAHGMFNKVIEEECERYPNVHLVDVHSAMLGHGIHCRDRRNPNYHADDPHYWYYKNLEDPNDRGYDAIRRVFLLKIVEVLAQSSVRERDPSGQVRRRDVFLGLICVVKRPEKEGESPQKNEAANAAQGLRPGVHYLEEAQPSRQIGPPLPNRFSVLARRSLCEQVTD
jgi:hypothetical protein